MDMGKPICFISGAYDGQKGWFNISKENMPKMCYVIVDKKKGFRMYTCVKQANVADPLALVMSKLTATLACCKTNNIALLCPWSLSNCTCTIQTLSVFGSLELTKEE
jgi:hypothetical protein